MKIPGPNEVGEVQYNLILEKVIPSLRHGLRILFRDGCPYPKEDTLYVGASEVYQRKLAYDLKEAGWKVEYNEDDYDTYEEIKISGY